MLKDYLLNIQCLFNVPETNSTKGCEGQEICYIIALLNELQD